MLAIASRSRRNTLTNVIVREPLHTWPGHSTAVAVQVFDILSVLQASGDSPFPQPLFRLDGMRAQHTFQNVCSYYQVRIAVRHKW
jgi:hypothetical protein